MLKYNTCFHQNLFFILFLKHILENSPSVLVATAGGRGSSENKTILQRHQLPVIEDWELPPQYRRCALDETEINAINVIYYFFTFLFFYTKVSFIQIY